MGTMSQGQDHGDHVYFTLVITFSKLALRTTLLHECFPLPLLNYVFNHLFLLPVQLVRVTLTLIYIYIYIYNGDFVFSECR